MNAEIISFVEKRKIEERKEITDFFENFKEFEFIPEYYRNRIIDFFLEDDHSFVDLSDVRHFVERGTKIIVFHKQDKLIEILKANPLLQVDILGYKIPFELNKDLSEWIDGVSALTNNQDTQLKTVTVAMSRLAGVCENDPEEWYLLSITKPMQQLIGEQLLVMDFGNLFSE